MKLLGGVIGLVVLLHGPFAVAANLVSNPGFEDAPDFTGWTQSGNLWYTFVSEIDPHSGQYEATLGPFDTLGYLSQDLPTIPGESYEISWWLYSNQGSENQFTASFGGTLLFDQTGIPAGPWTKYTHTAIATGNTTTLTFGFANRPGVFRLDDIDAHQMTPGTPGPLSSVGVYRTGTWYLDKNANGLWDGCGTDACLSWGGDPADQVVLGDWNGTGTIKVGVYRNGTWYLDTNGNGLWDGCGTDACVSWGGDPADIPIVGDWNHSGTTKVGVYRASTGTWYLDTNGNGLWDGCGTDACISWGGDPADAPVLGDWNGSGSTKIGVYRNGTWYLDTNGNGSWDSCGTDACINWGGDPTDVPKVGDWNGSGATKIGVYRASTGTWYLDTNGNGTWDGCGTDACISWGGDPSDQPIVGKW